MRGGVVLRLPLVNIKEELEKYVDLGFLESDESLITYLEGKLALARMKRYKGETADVSMLFC